MKTRLKRFAIMSVGMTVALFISLMLLDLHDGEAREKLLTNHADFILANDLENIQGNDHRAFLVSKNHEIALETKAEIADRLLKTSEELKND